MQRRATIAALFAAVLAPAAIIDRVAVALGNQVITESEIIEEIRVTAYLNGEPVGLSSKSRHAAADRLIEQKLVRKERELERYGDPPGETAAATLAAIEKRYPNPAAFDRALHDYGLTKADLQAHLLWQSALLQFVEQRFRPAVQVNQDDVKKYFEEKVLPGVKPGQKVSLDEMRESIEETLTSTQADKQLDDWLRDTRARTHIEFFDEAFR